MNKESEAIFVRLDGPLYLRKNIIKCIINLEELKKKELKIRGIKQVKYKEIGRLYGAIKTIQEHINFLDKGVLPEGKEEHLEVRNLVKEKKQELIKKKGLSELDRLKLELNEIEARLNRIEF